MSLTINKEELLLQYKKYIEEINDETCVSIDFTGEQTCNMLYKILKANGNKITMKPKTLYAKYMNSIFHISNEDWNNNYSIKDICGIVYDIIDKSISS